MKDRTKLNLWLLAIAAVFVVALVAGCGYAERKDPPLFTYETPRVMQESARLQARDVGGYATGPIGSTNSMLPLIRAGDWLVIRPAPFTDALLGKVCTYQPKWHPSGPVAHRFVSGNAQAGFIPSGDANPRSEAFEPITAATYRGEVVGIYRVQP